MIPALRKIQTDDRATGALQDWADKLMTWLSGQPEFVEIQNFDLATGSQDIPHRLGRALRGWIVTRQSAAADLYDTQDANPLPTKTLRLVASAPVRVSLVVF